MTTNYTNTFIHVAPDCPTQQAEVPQARGTVASIAELQHEMLAAAPYRYTSDDLLFAVHATRKGIEPTKQAREAFFATSQACLRASPLAKRYGWGLHHDAESRVALVPLGSGEYERLSNAPAIAQVNAMRNKRV